MRRQNSPAQSAHAAYRAPARGMIWPCRGGYCFDDEPQPATAEASSRLVTPDRRKAGLEVSPVDAVTLSDGEGRENARGAADLY